MSDDTNIQSEASAGQLVTYLNGVDAHIELPVSPQGAQDISFRVQFLLPTGSAGSATDVFTNNSSNNFGGVMAGGRLYVQVKSSNVANYNVSAMPKDVWHELVITYDGVNGTSQLNGGTIYSKAITGDTAGNASWYLGARNGSSRWMECYVREVAIGTIASPEIAIFDDTTWVNKGTGANGIITNAQAVLDPAA